MNLQIRNAARIVTFLFAGAILFSASLYAADQKDIERVSAKLSCFCGTCPHLVVTQCRCSTADKIMVEVGTMLDKGMTDQQIIQNFVDRYGNTVLSSPPKSGFNLTAYVIPFVAFLMGGTALVAFLKHQRTAKSGETKPASPSAEGPEDERYSDLLNQELEKRK